MSILSFTVPQREIPHFSFNPYFSGWSVTRRNLSDDNIKRRIKLLARAKEILENTPYADEVREVKPGIKRYSLLGKFEDGNVVRVIVQEIKKEGKTFLSVFDLKDETKKLRQASLPDLTHDQGSFGEGKAPSDQAVASKNIIPLSDESGKSGLEQSFTFQSLSFWMVCYKYSRYCCLSTTK
ncbi:MAG: hypothetical protein HY806_08035 [Nitrospirae bacterium]|nr:hypothetical protein [Nitrospirota bacterium]